MNDLAAFLLARITEIEEAVWASIRPGTGVLLIGMRGAGGQTVWTTDTLLAECEAKRRIVGRLAAADRYAATGGVTTEYAEGYDHGILDAARFLALPYADHADYRPEWRP
jgi:hypothetical protein